MAITSYVPVFDVPVLCSMYLAGVFGCTSQAKNCDFFKQYVTEDFNTYLTRKRSEHCHGNHVEMQALCELYNRPIEVYQLSIGTRCSFIMQSEKLKLRPSRDTEITYSS